MALHDYEAERALAELVDKATSKRNDSLDRDLLHRIKRACRASETSLRLAFDLLYERLKNPNSQVRFLALEIIAELFQRSALFRSLLAAKFPRFLSLVLGFRTNEPLPPPTGPATQLRQRALELLEKWQTDHGSRHPQIALGYSYVKDTLRFEFPQLDARREAAEAAQREREARAQQLAQQRYHRLLEEWPGQAAEHHSLLRQFTEAFALLEQESNPKDSSNEAADEGGGGGGGSVEWEDVAEGRGSQDPGGSGTELVEAEGLAAYAAAEDEPPDPDPLQNDVSESSSALDPIIETLDGVYKLICNQALPRVQEALRVIVRAEVGSPGEAQHTQRELLLRAATALKSELAAAKERFESAHLDLAALAQAQVRRREAREKAQAAALAAKKRENPRIEDQAASLNKRINPYDYIRDPAAPLGPSLTAAATSRRPQGRPAAVVAPRPPPRALPRTSPSSSIPASLRASLASRAPVLPAGAFVRVWDSGTPAVPQYISNNGLEVANHWGPVDVHQELPSERLEELFLYAPSSEQQQRDRGEQGNLMGNASTSGQGVPGSRGGPAGRVPQGSRSRNEATQVPAVLSLASGAVAMSAEGRRAQRAAERAYNDAVISAAATGGGTDEALARALENPGGAGPSENDRKRASKKRKGTTKERLHKKLLGGRAAAAVLADAEAADSSRHREQSSNRW